MFFFPYKLDISLYRIPLLTILVCIVCAATFWSQLKSSGTFIGNLRSYCTQETDANLHAILQSIDDEKIGAGCVSVFLAIRNSKDRDATIEQLAHEVRGLDFYRDADQDIQYKEEALRSGYGYFETLVPRQLTDKLAYRPDHLNVITMITSTFAHADWSHLLGNLLFFFIFASCVEAALGSVGFLLVFLTMAITTSLAYSYSTNGSDAVPTIGLSGVAMGMMAMLTTMLPRAKIWCFFWFFFFFRRFTLPVLVIALWYIGWNVYDLTHRDPASHINYMAHVSGAVTGIVLGLAFRMIAPAKLDGLALGMNS